MKVFYVISIPSLIYYYLVKIIIYWTNGLNHNFSYFIVFLGVLIVLFQKVNLFFSIAWWTPLFIQSTPQTTAIFFALISYIIFESHLKNRLIYSSLFILISSLFQFQMSIFVSIFFFINLGIHKYKLKKKQLVLMFFLVQLFLFSF